MPLKHLPMALLCLGLGLASAQTPSSWQPPASIEAFHGFSPGPAAIDSHDTTDTDTLLERAIVPLAVGIGLIVLYILFRIGHCCRLTRKCCCCCYDKKCASQHLRLGKLGVALLYLAAAGAMTASMEGSGSLKDAMTTISGTTADAGDFLLDLKTHSTTMGAQSVDYGVAVDPGFTCKEKQNPDWQGIPPTHRNGLRNNVNSAVDNGLTPFKSDFGTLAKDFGGEATKMGDALGDNAQKIKKDGKELGPDGDLQDYIDMGVMATIALVWVACLFALLGTLCLSKGKGCCCGCKWSTLFSSLGQLIGLIVLLLLTVLITAEFVVGTTLADICHAGGGTDSNITPETNLLKMAEEQLSMDVGGDNPLEYYMTCNEMSVPGQNPLEPILNSADTFFKQMETRLSTFESDILGKDVTYSTGGVSKTIKPNKIWECTEESLTAIFPRSRTLIQDVNGTMSCANLNPIFLKLTRKAMCTEVPDGLYTLLVVQSATGVLFLLANVVYALVMASYKHAGNADTVKTENLEAHLEAELARPKNAAVMIQQGQPQQQADVYV